jgi:Secretin and TonB N terminus short domain/TonB-dependent Receptor Plug Domain
VKNLATACYAALWLLATAAVHADARDDAPVTLNIAPQPLRSALKQLSQQAGVQVLLRVDNLSADTVMAPPLKGKLTIRAALDLLLANTGLSYEFVNSHTIRVSSAHKPVSGTTEPLPGLSSFAGVQAGVAEGGGDVQLQEVVVTATKRSERLQDTAMALTVVGRDDIQALGAKTLEDVARTVPGLLLSETGYGYTTPVIRGIVQGGGVATIGYYVDDTPVAAILRRSSMTLIG